MSDTESCPDPFLLFLASPAYKPKISPEVLNSLAVLRPGLPRLDRELELGLFHSRRDGLDVGARGNSPERAQALLRGFGQKKVDKQPRRIRMGRLGTQACRVQRDHHRVDGVHPFDGRASLLHLFDAVHVDNPQGELSGGHELRDQRMPLAPLYLLLRQSPHVFLRSLFAQDFVSVAYQLYSSGSTEILPFHFASRRSSYCFGASFSA